MTAVVAAALPARAQLDDSDLETGLLPTGDVFGPLWGSPVWPQFSASYNRYADDDYLENVAAFGIGATIPIYRWHRPAGSFLDWTEVGAQTAIFADFDQDRFSRDQFSADFVAGLYVAGRQDRLSGMIRAFHRSSHVGDEYLTNDSGVEREDFAFERLDLFLSYALLGDPYRNDSGLARVYGGIGRTPKRPTPKEWGYLMLNYGLELRSPHLIGDAFRPVAAADVTHQEGNDFKPDITLRAGVQAEHPSINGRTIRFLVEYYNGKEPNGQFFEDDATIIGFGVFFTL